MAASLEIISYRDPHLLHNHLRHLLQSSHAVPTATDLLATFFDRAAKFPATRLVFIDMAIQVLVTTNITLDRTDLLKHRPTIIHRLTEIVLEGVKSDWLLASNCEGFSMTQIYRYIVRSATSDFKDTRGSFNNLLPAALSALSSVADSAPESSACISMELGEFYLMNADFTQATSLLTKANSLFTTDVHSETSPKSSTASHDNGRYRQIEASHQDPDQRISKSRLEALLRAAGHDRTSLIADGDIESLASRLGGFPIPYPSTNNVIIRSIWDFLLYSTPMNIVTLAQEGVDIEQLVQTAEKVAEGLSNVDLTPIARSYYPVERLRMWIEQSRLSVAAFQDEMMIENGSSAPTISEHSLASPHSRIDLIERIESAFMQESQNLMPPSQLSARHYDDVCSCAIEIEQMNPEKVVPLLLDSNESSIAERFVLASPKNAFCVAALLSLIANTLQESPLKLDMSFFGGDFTGVKPKPLLSKLKTPAKDLRSRLMKCLYRALITSIPSSPNITSHMKAVATVLYAQSDFANCTRVLLDIIRVSSKETFLNSSVLTDSTYYEMLITSLSEIGESFDAAVLCQVDMFFDLERGSRLLMTHPRRFQTDMFMYILYPELVEALVYTFDKICPDRNKKQIALNLMSRPIMVAKRNHPDRPRVLNKFITNLLLNPKFSSYGILLRT